MECQRAQWNLITGRYLRSLVRPPCFASSHFLLQNMDPSATISSEPIPATFNGSTHVEERNNVIRVYKGNRIVQYGRRAPYTPPSTGRQDSIDISTRVIRDGNQEEHYGGNSSVVYGDNSPVSRGTEPSEPIDKPSNTLVAGEVEQPRV